MKNKQQKTIIVLGMHKSGTSLVAGVLKKAGVNMGDDLLGRHWSNPLGHFEDMDFFRLNRKILREVGGGWDSPPSLDKVLSLKEKFHQDLKNLFNKKYERNKFCKFWGWKDPRTNLTIELLLPYLKNPYFIVCYRRKEDIIKSLKKRDGFSEEKSSRLIDIYNSRIENFFQKNSHLPRIDFSYDDIVNNKRNFVKKLENFLGFRIPFYKKVAIYFFIKSPKKMKKLEKKLKNKKRNKFFIYLKVGIKNPKRIFLKIKKIFNR